MERQQGRVLSLSSESGLNIPADMIHCGCTKAAIFSISCGLAKRAAGTDVTVTAILPGSTVSDGLIALQQEE